MRILYVEDVPPNLYLVERIASMGQHEVVNYASAEEALRNWGHDQPDMVMVDYHLEGEMNGLDFIRELRMMGCTLPVVVITAYASDAMREASFEVGADEFFSKPLQVRHFWRLVQQYDQDNQARV